MLLQDGSGPVAWLYHHSDEQGPSPYTQWSTTSQATQPKTTKTSYARRTLTASTNQPVGSLVCCAASTQETHLLQVPPVLELLPVHNSPATRGPGGGGEALPGSSGKWSLGYAPERRG